MRNRCETCKYLALVPAADADFSECRFDPIVARVRTDSSWIACSHYVAVRWTKRKEDEE